MTEISAADVEVREAVDEDFDVFYEHQLDPEATAMAGFPSRTREAHDAHWAKTRRNPTNIVRTITVRGEVAGDIGSWLQDDHREVGYWIGRQFWGMGVATAALRKFLDVVTERPLVAHVVEHNTGSIRVLEKAGFVRTGQDGEELVYQLTDTSTGDD